MLTYFLGVVTGVVASVLVLMGMAAAVCVQQTKIERDRGD